MKKFIFAITLVLGLTLGGLAFAAELNLESYGTIEVPEVVQKTIKIHKGWNLVHGFAGREWITGGIDVAKSDIKAIFGLNSKSKQYVRFYPTPEKEKISEFSAIPYLTYWIYSDKNGTLNYQTGKHPTRNQLFFMWPAGWNIIAITPDMFDGDPFAGGTFSWNSLKGSCNFEKINAWNPENNTWMKILPEDVSSDFNDFLGSGMLVKVSNDCKLAKSNKGNYNLPPPLPN